MAPIPLSSLSNDDKNLWKSYLDASAAANTVSEQFKAGQPKYVDGHIRTDPDSRTPRTDSLQWYEIYYNGSTLKFTVEMFGKQPDSGYPVYMFLHGGGTDNDPNKAGNNAQWYENANHDSTYYRGSVAAKVAADKAKGTDVGAMYIAARGLTNDDPKIPDTWDLHCMPNSYVLYTKLIRQLIRPSPFGIDDTKRIKQASAAAGSAYTLSDQPLNFVDSNQIYITGFSAGGDGVYNLATSLADHFSAANMSAGHPGGARFENLANVAFSMQVGALDVPFWRSRITVEKFLLLRGWNEKLSGRYIASCSIHKTSSKDPRPKTDPNYEEPYGWRHNSWEAAEGSSNFNATSQVFKQTGNVLKDWLAQVQKCTINPNWNPQTDAESEQTIKEREDIVKFYNDNSKVTSDSSVLETINTNAIKWCGEVQDPTKGSMPRLRDSNPSTVVWNLGGRPRKPDNLTSNTTWVQQKFFYWLYIRNTSTDDYKPYKDTTTDLVIRADRNGNTIFVNQPYNFLGILLNEHIFDFTQPIQVIIPSKPDVKSASDPNALPSGLDANNCIKLDTVTVKVVPKIKEETLQARGDLNYMFSAAIWFENKGGKWQANVADTLLPGGASPLQ